MEQNVLLDLSHISKRYKTELALKDINMELHPGRQKFLIQIRLILMNQFMKKLVWFLIRAEFMRK